MVSFGIVGIGFMGKGIAKNVILKGPTISLKELFLYDINPEQVNNLLRDETAKRNDSLHFYRVKDACRKLLFDEDGVVTNHAREKSSQNKRKIIIDHSTYSKKFVQYCSEKARDLANIDYIDAPVSGGPQGAWNGTLSVMIGGNANVLPSIIPYLGLYSATHKYFGVSGAGMAAKLVNQALVGMHAQAACEAIRLAEKLGITDLKLLQELLSNSWGQSKILDLVLSDFNKANTDGSFTETLIQLKKSKSAAPLRNMDKDFQCIDKEIQSSSTVGVLNSFPLLRITQDKIHVACTKQGLQDAPFASLTSVE